MSAELVGYRNGPPRPGSPLYADYGPESLPDTGEADLAPVGQGERTNDANAFTFTLPYSWTRGSIKLVATIRGPPHDFGPALLECTAAPRSSNNTYLGGKRHLQP